MNSEKKIICIFPPFCSPVSPPYSITYIANFLKQNSNLNLELLDLNAWIHKKKFEHEYKLIKNSLKEKNLEEYSNKIKLLQGKISIFTRQENRGLRNGKLTDSFNECLKYVLEKCPTHVLISVVYNSQAFMALELAKELIKKGIEVIAGGPAVTPQIKEITIYLPHEIALLEHLTQNTLDLDKLNYSRVLDYSEYDYDLYLTPEPVIPLRTTSTCYYQQCTFCTHHNNAKYFEYALEDILNSIICSSVKYVFFIDDMIHKKRLLEMAKILKPLHITWMCQLRPTKEFDEVTMKILYDSGLRCVIWGVESGNSRILDLMKKGTNVFDVQNVLRQSAKANVTNVTYIMFGFPTETKEEFLDTINLLKDNQESIKLISTSVFGLQAHAPIVKDPAAFSIDKVNTHQREKLPDKLSYETSSGQSNEEARILQKKYKKTLLNINKFPKEMNIYREHMLYFVS